MDLGIDGRVALVMGASKGIGRGIAGALAAEGARVAITGRDRERIEATAAELPGDVVGFVADTGDLARMKELPGEIEAALGPIEILVTNTGGPPAGRALERSVEEWEAAFRALVLGMRVMTGAIVPGMRERGWGRIVNVGSTSTIEPLPGLTLSNSIRAAADGFLMTLANEVAADGVTVNNVATGKFDTDRLAELSGGADNARQAASDTVPAGRLGRPEEYGDLVAFLASTRAAYITATTIRIDGGFTKST